MEDFDIEQFSDEDRKLFEELLQSREIESFFMPFVQFIERERDELVISGEGEPSSQIVLLLHSKEQYITLVQVDDQGNWEYRQNLQEKTLLPGRHSVYTLTYDREKEERGLIIKKEFILEEEEKSESDEILEKQESPSEKKEEGVLLWKIFIFFGIVFVGGFFLLKKRFSSR